MHSTVVFAFVFAFLFTFLPRRVCSHHISLRRVMKVRHIDVMGAKVSYIWHSCLEWVDIFTNKHFVTNGWSPGLFNLKYAMQHNFFIL